MSLLRSKGVERDASIQQLALLTALGRKLATWAEALIRLIGRLDTDLPSWRTVEGMTT
jgi:hypothetical protein